MGRRSRGRDRRAKSSSPPRCLQCQRHGRSFGIEVRSGSAKAGEEGCKAYHQRQRICLDLGRKRQDLARQNFGESQGDQLSHDDEHDHDRYGVKYDGIPTSMVIDSSQSFTARGTTSARKENKDPNDDESNAQPSVSSSNFAMPIFGSLPPAPNAAQKPALPPMPGFGPVPAIPKTPAPPTSFNNYKYSYSYGAGNDLDGPDVPQKMFDETFDSDFDELEPIENWGKRSNKSTGAGPATKKIRKTY